MKNMIKLCIGDSIELLKGYPDNHFDCVFTSPPFKDEDVNGDYWTFYDGVFNDIIRVSSKLAVIIHSATKMNEIISKYPPKRTLIWGKGMIQASYRYNPIFIYQISDEYKVNKYLWCDTFGIPSINGKDKSHVYQDPELLYYTILKMFKGIKTVLDPFAGSGTTGRACRKLELDCTMLEIQSDYEPLIKDVAMINYPKIDMFNSKMAVDAYV